MSFVASDMSITELGEVPADARLPTDYGDFRIRVFHEDSTGSEYVALTLGVWTSTDLGLDRVHSKCLRGDALGRERCDSGAKREAAMRQITQIDMGCSTH